MEKSEMKKVEFPAPRYVVSNGLRMAVYEAGQASGLPVVFSHGFPELAYSWRHQLAALAQAGYRAIAPDQRGYGLTERPEPVEAYDIVALTGDLVGLLDAAGIEKAVFCGHDWGGAVVWAVGQLHPSRVAGLIGVNTPFLPRSPLPPIELMRAAMGPEHYIVHFQTPGDADTRLARDVRRVFDKIMRKGIKLADLDLSRGVQNLATSVESEGVLGQPLLDEEELAVFVRAFERTGFTGGINWYRNIDRNWRLTERAPQKIEAPALMVCAEDDFALPPSLADGMEAYVPRLEKKLIRDCGHWTQQERPEELNALLLDWLGRTFPR
jgi:pimeloyl-ACP methyl ester carboxylesterase